MAATCLVSRVHHLDRVVGHISDRAIRQHGLTSFQLTLLVAVELAGPIAAPDLGRGFALERSTVCRNLARLASAKLLETGAEVRITPRGSALIRACHEAWRAAQREASERLGPDLVRVLSAFEKEQRHAGNTGG